MNSSLYTPLLLVALLYAGLMIASDVVARRGNTERSERYQDLAFGTALAAGAYTAILLVLAAIDAPNRFTDAIITIAVVLAFFALLLGLLFLISLAYGRLRRRA